MNVIRTVVMAKNVLQEVIRDRILYIIGFYAIILAIASFIKMLFSGFLTDKSML